MNIIEWLAYLNSLPSGLTNKSLNRIKNIANQLGLLNFTAKIITVGGTNGKGSCTIFLESILLNAGYRTGAFISPHLLHYNERIRLNGEDIDNIDLIQAFESIYAATVNHRFISNPENTLKTMDYHATKSALRNDGSTRDSKHTDEKIQLSYFEFTLLVALYIFKKQNLDILILEVGLGGRFDAVNILNSDIAIITSISLDHTQILGNTREAIGYEKAGIMRANKPIIFGDFDVPKVIYDQARESGAVLYLKPGANVVTTSNLATTQQIFSKNRHCKECFHQEIDLKLPKANAETALIAIKLLQDSLGFNITQDAINQGLEQAFLPGRYQKFIYNNREVILDVAHNEESARLLAQNLIKNKSKGLTIAIMSMLGDKNILSIIQALNKTINKWYISTLNTNRAASLELLKQNLEIAKVDDYITTTSIETAFKQALAECEIIDRIVVFGSFYTVAIILESIKNES